MVCVDEGAADPVNGIGDVRAGVSELPAALPEAAAAALEEEEEEEGMS
jgi:hypothetical protein